MLCDKEPVFLPDKFQLANWAQWSTHHFTNLVWCRNSTGGFQINTDWEGTSFLLGPTLPVYLSSTSFPWAPLNPSAISDRVPSSMHLSFSIHWTTLIPAPDHPKLKSVHSVLWPLWALTPCSVISSAITFLLNIALLCFTLLYAADFNCSPIDHCTFSCHHSRIASYSSLKTTSVAKLSEHHLKSPGVKQSDKCKNRLRAPFSLQSSSTSVKNPHNSLILNKSGSQLISPNINHCGKPNQMCSSFCQQYQRWFTSGHHVLQFQEKMLALINILISRETGIFRSIRGRI